MNPHLIIIAGFGAAVLLATAAVTLLLVRFRKTPQSAVWVGGLVVPVFLSIWGFYGMMSDTGVDDAPPGMVLIGGVTLLALGIPFTLLTSFLVVRVIRPPDGRSGGSRT